MRPDFEISQSERNSVLFYQGSAEKIKLDESKNYLKDFYKVSNAYEVINSLLFPGIQNEAVRIAKEKRVFYPILAEHISELLQVYCNLYSVMCKYTYGTVRRDYYLYRKDRMLSFEYLKRGVTNSFISASFDERIDKSFCKKEGILLLEIEAPGCVEHLNVNEVLGEDSKYPEEKEILFAPFLYLDLDKIKLKEEEKQLTDINGEMPKAKYKIRIKGSLITCENEPSDEQDAGLTEKWKEEIQRREYVCNAINIWAKLRDNKVLDETELQMYVEWKKKIQTYLKWQFKRIKRRMLEKKEEFSRTEQVSQRIGILKEDIKNYIAYTNSNRKRYSRQFTCLNMTVAVLQPIGALAVALSLFEGFGWHFEAGMKIVSLICSSFCLIFMAIVKSLGLQGKLEQRTATYLRLDELKRDLRYETDFSTETINNYIERFKQIVTEDDMKCEENLKRSITYAETLLKDGDGD